MTLGKSLQVLESLALTNVRKYAMVLKAPCRARVQGKVDFHSFLILTCDLDSPTPDASQQGVCLCTLLHSRLCVRPEDRGDIVIVIVPLMKE